MRKAWLTSLLLMGMSLSTFGIVPMPLPRPVEPPMPQPGWVYRWIPAEYRLISEHVWIPERREWITECIEIRPGEWAERTRELLTPAHWETRSRRELVRGGYWAMVRVDNPPFHPMPAPADRTVGVQGYNRTGGEDLSAFSPLKEWPK